MIVRATTKLLKTSRIKPVKNIDEINSDMPGEWYAGLVSTGRQGKLVIHFLHHPTMISILVPGKSINKAIKQIPERCSNLLDRIGMSHLQPQFQLDSQPQVFTTNNKRMLGHHTSMRLEIELHLAERDIEDAKTWNILEDHFTNFIFTINKKFIMPKQILNNLSQ